MSDAQRLRLDDAADQISATQVDLGPAGGATSFVGKTTTVTTYPTVAGRFYAITPAVALGTETEGSAGSVTAAPGQIYAYNFGTGVPPSGTSVLVTQVPHRYVFAWNG